MVDGWKDEPITGWLTPMDGGWIEGRTDNWLVNANGWWMDGVDRPNKSVQVL